MEDKEFAEIINSTKGIVLAAIGKNLAARFYYAIDDVAQETYLRAYRSLLKNKFRGDSSISTWLYTIARNESLRMNKKLKREEEKFEKAVEDVDFEDESVSFENDPVIDDLREKISDLPEKYRNVMELISEGFSYSEVSKKLSLKAGTVRSRASRAREMLHRIYEGERNG